MTDGKIAIIGDGDSITVFRAPYSKRLQHNISYGRAGKGVDRIFETV